jgi:hypothetical protein
MGKWGAVCVEFVWTYACKRLQVSFMVYAPLYTSDAVRSLCGYITCVFTLVAFLVHSSFWPAV